MFFKKMAMVVLTAGIISGIWMSPGLVSAAEESSSAADAAVASVEEEADDTIAETDIDTSVQSTPAPAVSTPQVVRVTTNVAVTSGKQTSTEKSKAVKKYTKSELRLMASIINCEAGGESYQGQIAVGIVVMNRVKSKAFPNTIKKVIYQKGQFSPVRNGMLRKKLKQYDAGRIHSAQWKSCIKAAKKALNGQTTIKLKGKTKSMKGVRFFSVYMSGAKFRLGGHRFR